MRRVMSKMMQVGRICFTSCSKQIRLCSNSCLPTFSPMPSFSWRLSSSPWKERFLGRDFLLELPETIESSSTLVCKVSYQYLISHIILTPWHLINLRLKTITRLEHSNKRRKTLQNKTFHCLQSIPLNTAFLFHENHITLVSHTRHLLQFLSSNLSPCTFLSF